MEQVQVLRAELIALVRRSRIDEVPRRLNGWFNKWIKGSVAVSLAAVAVMMCGVALDAIRTLCRRWLPTRKSQKKSET
jgi:hypothetical protein